MKKKILLVDDEQIFHFLSKKIIEVSGIDSEVQSAFDGREALSRVAGGFSPDYIFVDLDMPNMNGLEFVEAYKKDSNQQGKIVVLTSSVTDDERKKALALGADVYMSKPLSEHDVKNLLKD